MAALYASGSDEVKILEAVIFDSQLLKGHTCRDLKMVHRRSVLCDFSEPAPGYSMVTSDSCDMQIDSIAIAVFYVLVPLQRLMCRRLSDMGPGHSVDIWD